MMRLRTGGSSFGGRLLRLTARSRVAAGFAGLLSISTASLSTAQVVEGVDYSDRARVYTTFDMTGTGIVGQRFPSEHLTIVDPVTGAELIALTTSRHDNSKLYQTHPQWTPDGRYAVFTSDRAAVGGRGRHVYAISMDDYEIVQVTGGDDGGTLHLGWTRNVAYHFRGGQLIELDLGALLADSEGGGVQEPSSYERVVASLPDSLRPNGGFALDRNEQRMFVAARLGQELSGIYAIDLRSGELTKLVEVPFRASHLQANPWVSGEVMYCWETGGDAPQRTWLLSIDDEADVVNRPAYQEQPDEWVTHEVFVGPDHILFNVMGHLDRLRETTNSGIYSMNVRTGEVTLHGQLDGGGYWHAQGTQDLSWAVGDTFDGRLYRLNLEDPDDYVLLTTGHRPNSLGPFTDEAHSHHSISPDGRWVLFNSSMLTGSDVMMMPLHPEGF